MVQCARVIPCRAMACAVVDFWTVSVLFTQTQLHFLLNRLRERMGDDYLKFELMMSVALEDVKGYVESEMAKY